MRKCTKCGDEKPLELFKKDKGRPCGRSSWCKSCHSKSAAEFQKDNADRARKNKKRFKKTEKGLLVARRYKRGEAAKLARERYNASEKGKEAARRWRHNRAASGGTSTLTEAQWADILELQDGRCNYCNVKFSEASPLTKPERDHIIPLSRGGSLDEINTQALCRSCNASKGSKMPIHYFLRTDLRGHFSNYHYCDNFKLLDS